MPIAFISSMRSSTCMACSYTTRPASVSRWAAAGLDQHNAQLILELLDLATERRLRDTQLLRRAGEIPLARNRDEIAEVPQSR